jgi:hypothetical protein
MTDTSGGREFADKFFAQNQAGEGSWPYKA